MVKQRIARNGEAVILSKTLTPGLYILETRHEGQKIRVRFYDGREAHAAYRLSPARIAGLAGY